MLFLIDIEVFCWLLLIFYWFYVMSKMDKKKCFSWKLLLNFFKFDVFILLEYCIGVINVKNVIWGYLFDNLIL